MFQSQISRRRALLAAAVACVTGCSSKKSETEVTPKNESEVATEMEPDMNSVTESWRQIDDWLSANAPKIVDNLNPPATETELRDAEESLGMQMPPEWHELYRGHNGMNSDANFGSLFFGMQFLTLEESIADHKENSAPVDSWLPVRRASDAGIRTDDMHNPNWIAIANSGETLIRVDMLPESTGMKGQVIFTDHADDTVILLGTSVAELISNFANDLEAGRYFLNKEALENGDQFLGCDPDIDVVNWSFSPRWKHLRQ